MNPFTRYGGIFAGIILVAFGIGSTVTGRPGRAGTGRPVGRDWYHPARPQIARCRRYLSEESMRQILYADTDPEDSPSRISEEADELPAAA